MSFRTALAIPLGMAASIYLGTMANPACFAQEEPTGRDLEADFEANHRRAAPRDAFPVLNNPPGVSAEEASKSIRDDAWVIGVTAGGEHKAYPIGVMGRHELANDVVGGVPIAASW